MKYRFGTRPYAHQRRALQFLLHNRGGGLQVPMRWGKTKVAIDFACAMHLLERVHRVLVVCPLSVVGVWETEIPKHSSPDVPPTVLTPSSPAHGPLTWLVVNFEQLYDRVSTGDRSWVAVPSKRLRDFNPDIVIIDESHRIGNPSTVTSREACRIGKRARFRVIMTGTMFHRKPFYVFGQAKFYDPSIFGTNFGNFKKRIAVMGGYGGYEVLRYINLKWMMRRMRRFVFMEEYVPPGVPRVNVLYFYLTGEGLAAYAEMEEESVLELDTGVTVVSPIVLSRHLRCQQIAGGWVKADGRYHRVGRDKFQMAVDRFQDYADNDVQKVVVGCRFIPELKDAAVAARRAGYKIVLLHGNMKGDDRTRRIRYFQESKKRIAFIAQIDAGREGIDLSAADTMLFYSLSESFVAHDQFSRRIERYKDDRVLQYDFLVARGTRDEVTYEAMQLKQDVAQFLITNPARVEAITAKKGAV